MSSKLESRSWRIVEQILLSRMLDIMLKMLRVVKLKKEFRQSQNDLSFKKPVNIIESVTNDAVSEVQLTIDDLVPASSKSLEDKKIDVFLNEVNKKNISNNMR